MMTAMPAVKPTVTGIGNELDVGAEPQEARRQQHQAGQEGREDQAVDAVLRARWPRPAR